MEKRFIGIKDMSEYLGLKVATLYDWVYRKKIPYVKIGRCVRFDLREIDLWAKNRRVEQIH